MMRYWVHALRYVKAYWSKKQVRETVINEEMDKKLLDQLLKEEEDEDEENDVSTFIYLLDYLLCVVLYKLPYMRQHCYHEGNNVALSLQKPATVTSN